MWPPDMKREYIIEQLSKRVPLNVLLKDRDVRRHQKAVDPETGALIGYARWILPDSKVKTEIGEPEWIEAQVPDVDADQRKTFEELSETAWWDPRSDLDDLDSKDAAVKQRILAERTYLSKFTRFPTGPVNILAARTSLVRKDCHDSTADKRAFP